MTLTTLRPATKADARLIASLFRISSEGVSDYIWQGLMEPGESLLDVGERRYARENTPFSYQNCMIAEVDGEPVGMMHAFKIETAATADEIAGMDPVLRPYAELEVAGSFYISGLAVLGPYRSRGLGKLMLATTNERARVASAAPVSLLCFADNTRARKLYEKRGFRVIDEREIVPHELIHATGKALLMTANVG